MKLGAEVIYAGAEDVHVSGHACAEELKIIQALIRPKNFLPCHGEYKMLTANSRLAQATGLDKEHIFVIQNGDILQISPQKAEVVGHIPVGVTLVDGAGIGDVGNIVLKDRKKLSEGGLFIVSVTVSGNQIISGPDVISRGFIYMRESDHLLSEAKRICRDAVNGMLAKNMDIAAMKTGLKTQMDMFLYDKTLRRPIVTPIIMEAKE